jgi:hypothetical protein
MVAAAERAHLVHPVVGARETLLKLRVVVQDLAQRALVGFRRRGQRAFLVVLLAPHRHVTRYLVEDALQALLVQIVGGERSTRRHHPATQVHPDGRGNDCTIRGDHRADGGADAGVHVGHRRDMMVDDRQLRQVDELLARARLHVVGVDLDRNAAFFDDLLYRHTR